MERNTKFKVLPLARKESEVLDSLSNLLNSFRLIPMEVVMCRITILKKLRERKEIELSFIK